jgi:itaconate CoA-transferase
MPGALDGLLVVSVEQAVAVPYCSARLADAGARVIKIERPEGDFARGYDAYVHGLSSYFVWLGRGKQSVTLDFKHKDDLALLHRMIAKAAVLIQNLAPGAAERVVFGTPNGEVSIPALAASYAGESERLGDVPAVGQHTAEVRREFGA